MVNSVCVTNVTKARIVAIVNRCDDSTAPALDEIVELAGDPECTAEMLGQVISASGYLLDYETWNTYLGILCDKAAGDLRFVLLSQSNNWSEWGIFDEKSSLFKFFVKMSILEQVELIQWILEMGINQPGNEDVVRSMASATFGKIAELHDLSDGADVFIELLHRVDESSLKELFRYTQAFKTLI